MVFVTLKATHAGRLGMLPEAGGEPKVRGCLHRSAGLWSSRQGVASRIFQRMDSCVLFETCLREGGGLGGGGLRGGGSLQHR